MQIDRILYPILSLGPGNRLVIWTVGCTKHCYKCSNSELWAQDSKRNIDVNELFCSIVTALNGEKPDGITITGGDPFEQHGELIALVKLLHQISDDILVYTGYEFSELISSVLDINETMDMYKYISVIVDGRYIDERNDGDYALRGSENQRVIILNENVRQRYDEYISGGRTIQNVYYKERVISIGIHNKENYQDGN